MSDKKALIIMDFINEIVHPDGKFKGKGYADFATRHDTLAKVNRAVAAARERDIKVVYVKLGFSPDYSEQLKNSPLFGTAHKFQALKLGDWATEFHESLVIADTDQVIIKHRISPFCGTKLDLYLRNMGITGVLLCGVATDLVVQSAARDAHDHGYNVTVIADCCAAGSDDDHNYAIQDLKKIAHVTDVNDIATEHA